MKSTAESPGIARWLLIVLLAQGALLLTGCGYLAAGAAGAAIGHEVAEDDEDD